MAAWEGKRDRWDGHHFWRPEWETSRPSPDAARVHRLLRERPAQAELGRGTLESQTNPTVWATRPSQRTRKAGPPAQSSSVVHGKPRPSGAWTGHPGESNEPHSLGHPPTTGKAESQQARTATTAKNIPADANLVVPSMSF